MSSVPPVQVELFGTLITDISSHEIVRAILDVVSKGLKHRIFNVNVHALNIAYRCPRFRHSLRSADLVFCDGFGVVLAARLRGRRLRHRNTPPDWLDELAEAATAADASIFLLGDEEAVVSAMEREMREKHRELRIVGQHHGFFQKHGAENDRVIQQINEAAPDIVLVGMGMPVQEFWIDENIERLNAKVFLPVGAAFRWYSGVEKRAPKGVTDHGFEWLARFARHPIKHFRRYAIGNPLLFIRLVKTYWLGFDLPAA